jgi:hypothetical protein
MTTRATTDAAFLAKIVAEPDQDLPRLVMAPKTGNFFVT